MPLDYHLELLDGTWKIVNYVADGADTVRNYRKQFKRLFSEYSFEQILNRLKAKINELETEDTT